MARKGHTNRRMAMAALLLLVFSLPSIYRAWSYTAARVTNENQLSVVNSRDALVAVQVESAVTVVQGEPLPICGSVTNNMAQSVILEARNGFTFQGGAYSCLLGAGESNDLLPPNESVGRWSNFQGGIVARWSGGDARVQFIIDLTIDPPPYKPNPEKGPAYAVWDEQNKTRTLFNNTKESVKVTIDDGQKVRSHTLAPGEGLDFATGKVTVTSMSQGVLYEESFLVQP